MSDSTVILNKPAGGDRVKAIHDDTTNVDTLVVSAETPNLATTSFGATATAETTPEIQETAKYNVVGAKMRVIDVGTGAQTAVTGGEFTATSGTSTTGVSVIFSKLAVAYHAGQGLIGRWSARFTAGSAGGNQSAGLLNSTDQLTVGYRDDVFGIFHNRNGSQELQKLTITGQASGSENATVTIDGTPYTVALTAGSASLNAQQVAASLNLEAGLALWTFQHIEEDVICKYLLTNVVSGAFTFSSATATGTFTQLAAAIPVTVNHIPQTSWNVDVMADLDPLKGNMYEAQLQYGYGDIRFFVEDPDTGTMKLVHIVKWTNDNTSPSVSMPAFRIGWAATNTGGTTSNTIYGSDCFIGLEGKDVITDQARAKSNIKPSVSTTATNIITFQNRDVFGTKTNLASIVPEFLSAGTDSTKGAVISLVKNATIGGTQNYKYINEDESITLYDVDGTTCTNGEEIITITLGREGTGGFDLRGYGIKLLPNDTLTVCGRVTSGAAAEIEAALIWQEDI